jgi:hypothetical protein
LGQSPEFDFRKALGLPPSPNLGGIPGLARTLARTRDQRIGEHRFHLCGFVLLWMKVSAACANHSLRAFLPLPATQEWGEDRGEGRPHTISSSPRASPPSDGGEGVSSLAGRRRQVCS